MGRPMVRDALLRSAPHHEAERGRAKSQLTLLPLHRAPANVAAVEALRPINQFHRLIRARLRFAHVFAARADVEHAAAVRNNTAALAARAGMKDLDAVERSGCIEAID